MKQQNEQQYTAPSLEGKKIVIIGGSSGIGLATAQAAAAEGAKVIIASSNTSRINDALKTLSTQGEGYTINMTDEQQVADMFQQLGSFDHLVYTAGESLQMGPIGDTELANARKYFNVRYWGAFMAVKYAAPHINDNGSVVLTGGIAALRPGKGWALGASICAAMEGFTRAMAIELAPIRVNLVSPGFVRTNLWNSLPEADRENLYTSVGNALLSGRVGEAGDIAQSYTYLMKQPFSTGKVIIADGGGALV